MKGSDYYRNGFTMEHTEDIFEGYGVEISLAHEDDFLKVKETLTRIGVSSRVEKNYIKAAISCTSEEDMLYFTSKSF